MKALHAEIDECISGFARNFQCLLYVSRILHFGSGLDGTFDDSIAVLTCVCSFLALLRTGIWILYFEGHKPSGRKNTRISLKNDVEKCTPKSEIGGCPVH